jgi:outer membrane receptor protein involved in Fe transport
MKKYFISLLLLCSFASYAEDATILDEVEVSAVSAGKGSDISKMDVSTTVITREEIKNRPQHYLDQLISRELGVWTPQIPGNQYDPSATVVGIRGFGNTNGEKVLVMVDGVPINDGYFKTIDWNQVPKETIDRIEIVKGGGGATLWGNLAEGGVINIITREPSKDELYISGKYGTQETKIGDAAATLYHSDNMKIGATFNTIVSDGYNVVPSTNSSSTAQQLRNDKTLPGSSKTNNGSLSWYFKPTDDNKFYVKLNASELLQEHNIFDVASNHWYKYNAKAGGELKYSETGSFNFNTFWDHSDLYKRNGTFISGTYNTSNVNNNQSTWYKGTNANALEINSQIENANYQTMGGSLFAADSFDLKDKGQVKDVKIGIDVRGINVSDNNNFYNAISQPSVTVGGSKVYTAPYSGLAYKTFNGKTNNTNLFEGIFAQGTWSPTDTPLDVTLGLRMDFWQAYNANGAYTPYTQTGLSGNSTAGNTVVSNQTDQSFNQFNPRLGLKYNATDSITIRGAVYRNFAAPSMNQMYRPSYAGGSFTLANPDLKPESNLGQEIGLDWKPFDNVKTGVTVFNNYLDNYIGQSTICGAAGLSSCNSVLAENNLSGLTGIASVSQRLNAGKATIQGIEYSLEYLPVEDVRLNFGFTAINAYLTSFNGNFNALNNAAIGRGAPIEVLHRQLGSVQPYTITAGGDWNARNLVDGLSFNWMIKSWPKYFATTLRQQYGNSSNNPSNVSSVMDGAVVADIGARYKATKQLDFTVTAQNISSSSFVTYPSTSTSMVPYTGLPLTVMGGFEFNY